MQGGRSGVSSSSTAVVVWALALTYFATAWLGLQAAPPPGNVSALWPPSGVGLAALLVYGRRAWPGIWLGAFAVNVAFFPTEGLAWSLLGAGSIALGSSAALLAAAALVGRLGGRQALSTPLQVVQFVGAAALASVISASVGLLATASGGALPFEVMPGFWVTWWLGDAVGMVAIAPLVMGARGAATARRALELAGLVAATVVLSQLVFGRPLPWFEGTRLPLAWLPLVAIVWAGVRFSPAVVAGVALVLYGLVSWGTLGGRGPFAALPSPAALLVVDGYLFAVLLTGQLLAAASALVARTRDALEEKVRERTATLEQTHEALTQQLHERARLDAQLRALDKQEALGRLAGGVAHDFNNLLTVILGAVSLLETEPRLSDTGTDAVRAVGTAGQRAAELTRQLLAVARRQPTQPRQVDVAAMLVELRRLLRPILPENVTLDVSGAPAFVSIDPTQLEQVLLNLAINARDAMPRGGHLRITTAVRELDAEAAAARRLTPGAWVVIDVADDGEGMTAEVQAHLFEPFFTTKAAERGTGLGLSTALGIAGRAGGTLVAESAAGRGSTFSLWLPRVEPEPATAAPAAPTEAGAAQATVLVVEDEPLVRRVVVSTLERAGYRVLSAHDGEEGLAVARRHRPGIDLVLTDVVMPRLGGVDLARALRAEAPVRVLFMSGYHERQAELELETVLPKPFKPDELKGAVAAVLRQPPASA